MDEFANKNKSKKEVMDLLTNIMMTKNIFTLALNDDTKRIVDRLCVTLLKEQEWSAISFTKIIQVLIDAESKEPRRTRIPNTSSASSAPSTTPSLRRLTR